MYFRAFAIGGLMFVLALFLPVGTTREISASPQHSYLSVHLCDTSGLSSSVLRKLKEEVGRLLGAPDLYIEWSDGCPVFETRPGSRKVLAYVLHRLPERMRRRLEVFKGSEPLAWFGRYHGSPRAMVYVSRSAVEARLSLAKDEDVSERLGCALGRVLAHELAHYYLGPCHARHGLLKRQLSVADLVGTVPKELFLTGEQRNALMTFAANR